MKDYILELDKPRELRFGFKATRLIRQKFGDRSLDQLMNMKVDEIPVLVWAGLKWEENGLTVEKVEDLLDAAIPKTYTILQITEIALEALAAQMGVDIKKAKAGDQETTAAAAKPEAAAAKKQPTKTTPSSKKQKK